MVKTHVALDFPKVPESRPIRIRALLQVEAEAPPGQRRPLNIGVVLDRSGSMEGEKIRNVREATKALAERLGGDDTFSLTIFDNVIETVIPPRKMGADLASMKAEVDLIQPRANTDLCGGYRAGCGMVLESRGKGALDRVVLLTDGLANVGVVNPVQIASIASDMAERGIVTSTVGVGADYSEHLLGRMAEAGGGNTYFLKSAAEVEEVLEEELGGLLSLAAEGLKVRFEPAVSGVRAEQLNAYRVAKDGAWILGDVYGSQTKSLALELEVPAFPRGKGVRCGTLHVSCSQTTDGGTKEFQKSLSVDLEVVSENEFAVQTMDAKVTLVAVELKVAAARTKAWEKANAGDFEGAAKALNECVDELEKIGSSDPAAAKQIENLRTEARCLKQDREAYYTPLMRKSMYTEAYLAGQGKFSHLGNMRWRHADNTNRFPLVEERGYLVTELDTGLYLVDTGCPVSVGDGSIRMGSRTFDLKPGVPPKIGIPVAGVLGADVLGQFDVMMDLRGGILFVDENCRALPGRVVNAEFPGGLPVLSAEIGGKPARLMFSTGSKPAGGNVIIVLGGRSYEVPVGPPETPGVDGVLGASFVLVAKRIAISARQCVVTLGDS